MAPLSSWSCHGTNQCSHYIPSLMNHLWDMTDIFVWIYLDDILIFSDSLEVIRSHPMSWNIFANPTCTPNPISACFTCRRLSSWVLWLPHWHLYGHCQDNMVSVWPTPTNLKAVQAFLGFANFYCWFIVGFSDIVIPLPDGLLCHLGHIYVCSKFQQSLTRVLQYSHDHPLTGHSVRQRPFISSPHAILLV